MPFFQWLRKLCLNRSKETSKFCTFNTFHIFPIIIITFCSLQFSSFDFPRSFCIRLFCFFLWVFLAFFFAFLDFFLAHFLPQHALASNDINANDCISWLDDPNWQSLQSHAWLAFLPISFPCWKRSRCSEYMYELFGLTGCANVPMPWITNMTNHRLVAMSALTFHNAPIPECTSSKCCLNFCLSVQSIGLLRMWVLTTSQWDVRLSFVPCPLSTSLTRQPSSFLFPLFHPSSYAQRLYSIQ